MLRMVSLVGCLLLLLVCQVNAATKEDADAARAMAQSSVDAANAAGAEFSNDYQDVNDKYNAMVAYYENVWQPANGGPDMDVDAHLSQARSYLDTAEGELGNCQMQYNNGTQAQGNATADYAAGSYDICIADCEICEAWCDGATQDYFMLTGVVDGADEELNLANQILQMP